MRAIIKARVNVVEGSNRRRLSRAFPPSLSLTHSPSLSIALLSVSLYLSLPLSPCTTLYTYTTAKRISVVLLRVPLHCCIYPDVGLLMTTYIALRPTAGNILYLPSVTSPLVARVICIYDSDYYPPTTPPRPNATAAIGNVVTPICTCYSTVIIMLLMYTITRVFFIPLCILRITTRIHLHRYLLLLDFLQTFQVHCCSYKMSQIFPYSI